MRSLGGIGPRAFFQFSSRCTVCCSSKVLRLLRLQQARLRLRVLLRRQHVRLQLRSQGLDSFDAGSFDRSKEYRGPRGSRGSTWSPPLPKRSFPAEAFKKVLREGARADLRTRGAICLGPARLRQSSSPQRFEVVMTRSRSSALRRFPPRAFSSSRQSPGHFGRCSSRVSGF